MPINEARLSAGQSIAVARPAGRAMRPAATRAGAAKSARSTGSIREALARRLSGIVSIFTVDALGSEGGSRHGSGGTAARLARIEMALDDRIAVAATREEADILTMGQTLLTDIRGRLDALEATARQDLEGGRTC